jgi:DNA-binding sugar fermentation-stimulating protein
MTALMLEITGLVDGNIFNRPSKTIKTPYVADILLTNCDRTILGHTASLGCCGLADKGASILMAPVPKTSKKNDKICCEYKVYLSVITEREREIIVGIHPKLAEDLTESAIKNNLLTRLKDVKGYKRETTIYVEGKVDSRFDFTGIDCNGVPFIMEVKNVPLADYEDITAKERKHKCYDERDINSKVAYFPDGYRKKSTMPVSPRALKHIRELTLIKRESITRCIMCYVIQRTDVECFQPSVIDPEYRQAVKDAIEIGVEIITLVVQWTKDGKAYFVRDDLPIKILV